MNLRSVSDGVTTVPRRERDRLRRRDDILRAAERVFAEKGYSASIDEIAREAEYATGTVYLYFKDKEALYVELFEEKIRGLIDLIEERISNHRHPVEALKLLIAARMEYFHRNRAFFQIYVREGMNLGWSKHDRWEGVRAVYQRYLDVLSKVFRAGQRQQLFRNGDPRRLAVALSGMMIQLTQDWLQSKSHQPLTEQSDFVVDLFLRGAEQR